jgi:hypothetical protein
LETGYRQFAQAIIKFRVNKDNCKSGCKTQKNLCREHAFENVQTPYLSGTDGGIGAGEHHGRAVSGGGGAGDVLMSI